MCRGLVFGFLFIAAQALADPGVLKIHGSNTVGAELAPRLVSAWLEKEGYQLQEQPTDNELAYRVVGQRTDGTKLTVEIVATGSSDGFRSVTLGEADISMSSRPIRDREMNDFSKLGGFELSNDEHVVALDGVAVVVNKTNPIQQLSIEQVRDVFSGRINRWSQLGWDAGGAISVYARDDQSGTFDTFRSLVMDASSLTSGAARYQSTSQLEQDVASDLSGIGFVAFPYVQNTKALSVNHADALPQSPDSFGVATEDYPLARRLYLYIPQGNRSAAIDSLLEFAQSEQGQRIVQAVGFVSQQPFAANVDLPESAPEDYLGFVTGAERLSVNLRFGKGRAVLDSKALQDLKRIKSYMQKPENKEKKLLLMGFSDAAESSPYMALHLSNQRVDFVANELLKLGVAPSRVRGFGQAMPVSSNDTRVGRTKNRRVEIWIKQSS